MNSSLEHRFSGPDLCGLAAHEIVELLCARQVSPSELLDAAFDRMAAVEPIVNAVPTLCEERAYQACDNIITPRAPQTGVLGGIPLAIKDLSPVAGVRTTYGTPGMANNVPTESDPLVRLLESRGAIVVGKSNTPEYGAGGNTFNAVLGATRNPWDTSLNAGGSSGGAGVSLATGELWLSHGSDHGGSLRTPAAYNAVVGLRPSPGVAASREKVEFLIEPQQGPMARSVRDCALFLDAMSGFQPTVPTSWPSPTKSYQQSVLEATDKVRIAFSPDLNGLAPVEAAVANVLSEAMTSVESNGGVVEHVNPNLPALYRTYHTLRAMYWASWFRRVPETITAHIKKTLADNIEQGRALTIDDIADANLDRTILYHNVTEMLEDFDVLACPTVGSMPQPLENEWAYSVNGVQFTHYMDWLQFSFLATVTGLPAMSVPAGFSDEGVPVGIQLIGKPRGESQLLAVAQAVEWAVGGPFGPIDPVVTHQ